VADLKPPRLDTGERETLCALLQYQRESMVRKVDGVSDAEARRGFVGSGTTLLWLMQHMAQAESTWIVQRFAGEDATPDPTLDADDTVAAAIEAYRAMWVRVDAIVSAASLDDRCRATGDDIPTNLRWVLMHLLEETARHAGHADILRELIDGSTGR
jgi:uncharacterized damage-inducible protein DinB